MVGVVVAQKLRLFRFHLFHQGISTIPGLVGVITARLEGTSSAARSALEIGVVACKTIKGSWTSLFDQVVRVPIGIGATVFIDLDLRINGASDKYKYDDNNTIKKKNVSVFLCHNYGHQNTKRHHQKSEDKLTRRLVRPFDQFENLLSPSTP
jgi:hypothetical protein